MKQKLRSNRGATLSELLCTVIVLLLITAMIATGTAFAVRSYRSSMADSQALILNSTLRTAITDKLRYCGSVSESGDKIFIQDIGAVSGTGEGEFFHLNDAGQIVLDEQGEKKLLSSGSYPQGLKVANLSVLYDREENLFRVSFDVVGSGGKVLSGGTFDVKRVNLPQESGT